MTSRREFVTTLGAAAMVAATAGCATSKVETKMYGLIGKIKVVPGSRDALIAILMQGTAGMPGCISYVIAEDASDVDALWITEVWDSPESHKASLALPSVKQAIAKGRPLIAGFGERFETRPIGGQGLGSPG